MFGSKRDEATDGWIKLPNAELHSFVLFAKRIVILG